MKKRERELAKPGVITRARTDDPTLAKASDRYIEESIKEIGRTKAQVLLAVMAAYSSGSRAEDPYQVKIATVNPQVGL